MDLGTSILTSGEYIPIEVTPFDTNANFGDVEGISIKWGSEETCENGGTNSFEAQITCDPMNLAQGGGVITNVDTSDPCNVVVSLTHDAGCPITTANNLTIWLSENPIVLAIILFIVGLLTGLFGLKWFPYVSAIITCLAVMELCTIISA